MMKLWKKSGESYENTHKDKVARRKLKLNAMRIGVAALLVVCVLWLIFGFLSNPEDNSPQTYQELLNNSPVITEKGPALIVDNVKISEDVWNYYFTKNAKAYAKSVGKELSEIEWDKKKSENETILEFVKYTAINDVVRSVAITSKAKKWGIELTDEDANKLTELDGQKELYGENVYAELGIKNQETFNILRANWLLEEKVRETICADVGKYSSDKNLEEYADGNSGTFKIIEIAKEYGESAEKDMKKIKERLDNGESFDKIWKEKNSDKTISFDAKAYPETVYIYKGSVAESHEEMEKVGLSLEIGEISGVIETDYSYAILKRVKGYTEVVNMVSADCEVKVNRDILDKTKVK